MGKRPRQGRKKRNRARCIYGKTRKLYKFKSRKVSSEVVTMHKFGQNIYKFYKEVL